MINCPEYKRFISFTNMIDYFKMERKSSSLCYNGGWFFQQGGIKTPVSVPPGL